jgi:hypothetical protein
MGVAFTRGTLNTPRHRERGPLPGSVPDTAEEQA